MFGLETDIFIFLVVCILAAAIFEFINGFHDTANAVATVIYTNSLKPIQAVSLTAVMNFLGVVTGGIGVGMSIVNLLPVDMLIDQNVYHSIAMVLGILCSAIIWNFGTWFFGIPSSSSHTLIGAIIGVGLGYAMLPDNPMGTAAINWGKAGEVFLGLILAPVFGFLLAFIMMILLKVFLTGKLKKQMLSQPKKQQPPPPKIRATMIVASALVGFFNGKNDGQKGVGLIMLILISILPTYFAINNTKKVQKIYPELVQLEQIVSGIKTDGLSVESLNQTEEILSYIQVIYPAAKGEPVPGKDKMDIRSAIINISSLTKSVLKNPEIKISTSNRKLLTQLAVKEEKGIRAAIDFAPLWVILLVSISLGSGAMVGWKRIVVTVGEKIGKSHMNYAQGASSGLVAALTIAFASALNLPVSTTHTLSSGVAGTMVSMGGFKNLDSKTIKNIGLTWLLTLPISIMLGAVLFLLFRNILPG